MARKLYVFLRSDLESMTPGKAAAQVAHAATQHALQDHGSSRFEEWAGTIDFGTTIVLDAGSFEGLDVEHNGKFRPYPSGPLARMVTDTSYPLRDGKIVHELILHTCYWMFIDPEGETETTREWLRTFKLYNGNHD